LREFLEDLAVVAIDGDIDIPVTGLSYHTDQVQEGGVFLALKGSRTDGHDFIEQAVARGARAVVVERKLESSANVTTIQVKHTRLALAKMASRYYGFPSQRLTVIGITGTNGKTTTSYLLESLFAACGHNVGVIGTVNIRQPGQSRTAQITTPESLDLQAILRQMLDSGVTHVIMEVSSHGLDMHRVDGTTFAAAIFTNLSQDHLDYHGTMAEYFQAKSRLFSQLLITTRGSAPLAVVNSDDSWGERLCAQVDGPLLRYGLSSSAQVRPSRVTSDLSGIAATVETPTGELLLHSPLLGRVNLYNILAATAVGVGFNVPLPIIRRGLEALARVPGRLERLPCNLGFEVVVDYAHTPDALQKALDALKELPHRRLLCVFGCGGDRDRSKRPLMGRAAAQRADLVIVTSDNPRSEEPKAIMADIEKGIRPLGLPLLSSSSPAELAGASGYLMIEDRARAIEVAIDSASSGDLVYIGGKGHETYQIIGTQRFDFDDRLVAGQALESRVRREKVRTGSSCGKADSPTRLQRHKTARTARIHKEYNTGPGP